MARGESRGVVLVTGAAQRIGRAIALHLASLDWRVAVHFHHSRDDALRLVDEIAAAGGDAQAFEADLSDEAATAELIPSIARFGPVIGLINNASVFDYDDIHSVTKAGWDRQMAVNLRAPLVLIQQFADQLPPHTKGSVVNLLDQRVWNLTPHFVSYTVSKAGLWTLTQTLALALAPRIRVNAIGPGPTLPSARQTQAQFAKQSQSVPLQAGPGLIEIAAATAFLLDTPSMTGQMIALDGGQHLGWAQPVDDHAPQE